MNYDFEVIIVGGGLGGAALGRTLAREGIRVLIVEREVAFRDRVRGEYMHPWGVTETKKLGIYETLMHTCGYEARYRQNHIVGLPQGKKRDMVETSPHQVGSMHFYHPSMQEVMLGEALKAGAQVQRGVVTGVQPGLTPSVRVKLGGEECTYQARLVVGADGRNSNCRKWMGFETQQDPERMMMGGVLLDNLDAPEDSVNFFINPPRGNFTVFTPLGGKRFRSYAGFYQQDGSRRLSGEKAFAEYLAGNISAGAPEDWLAGAKLAGPLASFSCAENWVDFPYKPGVALVGDAAATSDPCFGCGLSLVLRDVRVLSGLLITQPDWDAAGKEYATQHDAYFGSVHRQIDWLIKLYYEPGEMAATRREKAFARIIENPRRIPDLPGLGPEAPSDETAYRELFGEE